MTMYTELLEAAMKMGAEAELNAPTEKDRLEWAELNRVCRKEMYDTRGRIDALRKKDMKALDKVSRV